MTPRKPTRAKQLGIDDAEYARLLEAQGGHCALCPNTPKTRRLHVDHDHTTGEVRGLLCYVCNKYLPSSRNAEWHRAAADYLSPIDNAERDKQITRCVIEDGWSYQRAADRFGVTRQRAWQIVTKAGKA